MRTKWEINEERLQKLQEDARVLEAHMEWAKRTAFMKEDLVDGKWTKVPGWCGQCKEELATEEAFERHFVVTDERYLNLGECPNKQLAT